MVVVVGGSVVVVVDDDDEDEDDDRSGAVVLVVVVVGPGTASSDHGWRTTVVKSSPVISTTWLASSSSSTWNTAFDVQVPGHQSGRPPPGRGVEDGGRGGVVGVALDSGVEADRARRVGRVGALPIGPGAVPDRHRHLAEDDLARLEAPEDVEDGVGLGAVLQVDTEAPPAVRSHAQVVVDDGVGSNPSKLLARSRRSSLDSPASTPTESTATSSRLVKVSGFVNGLSSITRSMALRMKNCCG